MDIAKNLATAKSKNDIATLVSFVGSNQQQFDQLYHCMINGTSPKQKDNASWVLTYCVEQHPNLLYKHSSTFIQHLQKKEVLSKAVKRNMARTLQFVHIPSSELGNATDASFHLFMDKKESIAVKAFVMQVLFRICQREPALSKEFIIAIEDQLNYASAAIKSRSKKMLPKLRQWQ